MRTQSLILFCVCILFICVCQGAIRGKKYKPGDEIPLFINTVGPLSNPSVTFEYYSLPFCRPDQLEKKQTMGMAIDGDRLYNSLYNHKFAVPISNQEICTKNLTQREIGLFVNSIKKTFIFQMWFDGLPAYGFIGTSAPRQTEEGPVTDYYIFNHLHFNFLFNDDRVIYLNITADTNTSHVTLLDTTKESQEIKFTYSSKWEPTEYQFKDRNKLLKPLVMRRMEIHWLSILNSVGLVLLLTGFLAIIINRILRKDIVRYTKSQDLPSSASGSNSLEEDDPEDYGWKLVAGEVFRYPKYKTYLAALLGVGAQLLFVSSSLLILSVVGFLYPEQMGSIYSAGVIVFVFASIISGFTSGNIYHKMQGDKWVWNIVLAGTLFALPTALVSIMADIIARFYHSTSALPVITALQIFLIWVVVAFPLTVFGGIAGRRLATTFVPPVRVKNAVREIPVIPFYRQAPVQFIIGGFLPFSAIYIELHYVYAALWGHTSYGLYGVLLLVFIILLLVTACITIALTYFQLSVEDHNWWWRSFISAGSTGFFVFGYSIYYYFQLSGMSGFLQIIKYFSFVTISCYYFFVMLGTVGFISSFVFVKHIYSTLKID